MAVKRASQKKLVTSALSELKRSFGTRAASEIRTLIEENKALNFASAVTSNQADLRELTRHGNQWQQNTMAKYLGEFNPDEIPSMTYDRMRWDGQLRLGLMTVKMPIMSRAFWVDCEDKDIQAFVYQNLKEIWRPFIKSTLSALDFGFAPHEKIWEIAENYKVISKDTKINYNGDFIKYRTIKDLCPHTVTMDYSEGMKFKGFFQNRHRPGREAYVPADKAFIFTHDKEWGNMYGWARLKPAYPYWYTYWILDAWHERWLQKRGIPPIIVKYPIGKSQTASTGNAPKFKDNADIARDAAKSLQPDSVVTIPSDETKTPGGKSAAWEISTLMDTTKIDAFVQAKEKLDVRKLRAILVPERAITQDTSTGSFKMAESHIWMMMESLKGLIGDIADHTNEFLIPALVKNNFGDRAPRALLSIEEIGKELTGALFDIYLGLVQTGQAHPGVKKMEEVLNIPSETPEEKTEREEYEEKMGVPAGVSQGGVSQGGGFRRAAPREARPQPAEPTTSKAFHSSDRYGSLVDRVHSKFLESDLKKRSAHKDKMEALEEATARKKLSNLGSRSTHYKVNKGLK